MTVHRIGLLQQAASAIEEAAEAPHEEVSLIADLTEDADSARAKLLKAQKRYWKVWHLNLAIRNASYQPFITRNEGDVFEFMRDVDPALDVVDADCVTDDDLLKGDSDDEATEHLDAIALDSERIARRDRLLATAREQLEERKRVEAAAEVPSGAAGEALQMERKIKQEQRRKMQTDEEELRRVIKEFDSNELAAAKAKYQEILEVSRLKSQNTLRQKVLFEEAWEALQLVVEDADLIASLSNTDASAGRERPTTAPFAPRATTFLEDPKKEMQRHEVMRVMASQWLQEELDGVRHLCFAEQSIDSHTDSDEGHQAPQQGIANGRLVVKKGNEEIQDIFAGFRALNRNDNDKQLTNSEAYITMCPKVGGRLPWFTGMDTIASPAAATE